MKRSFEKLARAKILLQISRSGACVNEDESIGEKHDDAFKAKEYNASIFVDFGQGQDLEARNEIIPRKQARDKE